MNLRNLNNKYVIDEVWKRYGKHHKSFGGWYISGEISRKTKGAINAFYTMGKQCKDVSGGLPTFIGYMMSRTISVSKGGGKLLSYQENSLFGSGYGSDFVFSTETCIFSVSYTVPK